MGKDILENKAAVSTVEGEAQVIGYLTWYSVGEDLYAREDLRKSLLANNIEESFLPKPIRPADAFRRATKAIETKHSDDENNNKVYKNYIVRNVVSTNEKIQRNIVKEVVDQQGERLEYETEAAKVYFDKKNEQFTFVALDDFAEELAEEAKRLYEINRSHYNGQAVRGSITNYLKTMSPTPVRPSGGVYFVPEKYTENLRNLVQFNSHLSKGEAHMIPLIDSSDNRDMIRQKVLEHLQGTLTECTTALRDDKIPKGKVKAIIDEAKRVVGDFKDYRSLLADTVDHMENHVDLIRQQVQLLLLKDFEDETN
ncbi:DUF6744 family protein [Cytobacillus sp. IB215665]|uniref:DUF6744 family protein n=1 Tax=Cytobacillus sp. IB215665 TaxID=3097357 RepID=UPI002A0B78F5|nr:DUF6744 family protein [Cytobacillus sp. IB215665]MDX8367686.1 DUF6744 family protein [Cytobacillus sp. IB215665]